MTMFIKHGALLIKHGALLIKQGTLFNKHGALSISHENQLLGDFGTLCLQIRQLVELSCHNI